MVLDEDALRLPPGECVRQSGGVKYKLTILDR